MKKMIVLLPLMAALTLTACSSEQAAPADVTTAPASQTSTAPTESSSPAATPSANPKAIKKLEKLKDGFVAAGFKCDDWKISQTFPEAQASGICSNNVRIGQFGSSDDVDRQLEISRDFSKEKKLEKRSFVVGDTWIIEAPKAKKVSQEFDGKVVTL